MTGYSFGLREHAIILFVFLARELKPMYYYSTKIQVKTGL